MAFIPQVFSITARQPVVKKTHLRSKELPCISRLPNETRPFFIQWHIHAIDISNIMSISYAEARNIMWQLRSYYGKSKRDVITIDEFSKYAAIRKSIIRMYVMARRMENELRRAFPQLKAEHCKCEL